MPTTRLKSNCQTRLLVSVRSGAEARRALNGGAALIDVKEPAHGSLGAAHPRVLEDVLRAVNGRVPVSAALGELTQWQESPWHVLAPSTSLSGWSLAKLGLAGCGTHGNWPAAWRNALDRLPRSVAPVAVIYGDWQTAQTPPPAEIMRESRRFGCRSVLIDTFSKSRGSLLDHCALETLERWVHELRSFASTVVVAGSLSADLVPRILTLEPDYVAVRSAVCDGRRTGPIRTERVRQLARMLDICRKNAIFNAG